MRPNAAAAVRLGRRAVTAAALAAQRAGVRPPGFVQAHMRRLLEGAACSLPEALVPGWDSPLLPGGVALIVIIAFSLAFVPLRRMFALLGTEQHRAASWLLVGSVISLVPVLAQSSRCGLAPAAASFCQRGDASRSR